MEGALREEIAEAHNFILKIDANVSRLNTPGNAKIINIGKVNAISKDLLVRQVCTELYVLVSHVTEMKIASKLNLIISHPSKKLRGVSKHSIPQQEAFAQIEKTY